MQKIYLCLFLTISALIRSADAEEGMWPPFLISKKIAGIQKAGLRLSASDIYDATSSSMKDAVPQFGGGCTAVLVSPEGLLLTNHHCGSGAIQRLSSFEKDYLKNGYWALSREDEIPSPGTTVTFLVRLEDVTDSVLDGVGQSMNETERSKVIKRNTEKIEKEAVRGTSYEAKVKPFYYGNQYILFVNEVFRDIRFVGAPPSSIGNFGGDSDNWVWPRHTGDFSVFRIYASPENTPASYSKNNVPYKPRKFLNISLKGVKQGDFTMVLGFPGTTREYLPSCGVDLIAGKENPAKVTLRQKRLEIMEAAMNADPRTGLRYASKRSGLANGWKKMMGESKGIERVKAVISKQNKEEKFSEWVKSDSLRKIRYSELLTEFRKTYAEMLPYDMAGIYIQEGFLGIELLKFASSFKDLLNTGLMKQISRDSVIRMAGRMKAPARVFYRDYNIELDQKIAASILGFLSARMDEKFKPEVFRDAERKHPGDLETYIKMMFRSTVFSDSSVLMSILEHPTRKNLTILRKETVTELALSVSEMLTKKITPVLTGYSRKTDSLMRIYMKAQMEYRSGELLYPDANLSFRIAFGKVEGYEPSDAVKYNYFSTFRGILQKDDPASSDYIVDPRLRKLFENNDFGRYADADGTLHLAFIASNHTSGGNSGSPVVDGEGRLVGLNFDRNWEGTMSDLQYDPDQCRNIVLDIRYCLFIIGYFGNAGKLIDEMNLVPD